MTGHSGADIALSMLVIFASAKLLSEIFERLGQPGIVGEILAGIVIGPHALGWIAPNEITNVLADLGVMFLLFRVGLEVKSSELTSRGGHAAFIAVLGVVLPFLAGWGLSAAWDFPVVESIFVGAALVATSVGITAQVLAAGGWMDRRASKLILAAAVIDDVLGLLVLAGASGVAKGRVNYLDLALTVAIALGFTVFIATLGSRALNRIVPRVNARLQLVESEFAIAMTLLFALSLLAVYAGVAAIVGAFLAGMALSETVEHRVAVLTNGVTELLVPFFLVGVGLHFDIAVFKDARSLVFASVLTLAAVLSKLAGCGLAALPFGRGDALRVGIGMIPRGEVGMVVAQIGLGLGVIAQNVYGTIVFVSLATTLIAPPLLRLAYRRDKD
jgi:Kef-type K+ transport system membrane component KefB